MEYKGMESQPLFIFFITRGWDPKKTLKTLFCYMPLALLNYFREVHNFHLSKQILFTLSVRRKRSQAMTGLVLVPEDLKTTWKVQGILHYKLQKQNTAIDELSVFVTGKKNATFAYFRILWSPFSLYNILINTFSCFSIGNHSILILYQENGAQGTHRANAFSSRMASPVILI